MHIHEKQEKALVNCVPNKLQRNQALQNFSCEGSKYFSGLESFSIAWFHKFYVHVAIP